ncbi:MAG TPA: S8 family serine peptidase, partial [Pirellulaceae bacterium]
MASDWHNAALPGDVDSDRSVTPLDALVVINELTNRQMSQPLTGLLPTTRPSALARPRFLDVTGDQLVTRRDAQEILAFLSSDPAEFRWRVETSFGFQADQVLRAHPSIPAEILTAFQHAADLSQYTSEQLATVRDWVVLALPGSSTPQIRQQLADPQGTGRFTGDVAMSVALGTPVLTPTRLIEDTYTLSWNPGQGDSTTGDRIGETIDRLRSSESVVSFYPQVARQQASRLVPDDALYPEQWHLKNRGQWQGTPGIDVNIERAWDNYTGAGVVIGIVDDGVQRSHPDLQPNSWTNPLEIAGNNIDDDQNGLIDDLFGWDFSFGDNDPSPVGPLRGHGTAVTGVAAGRGNNSIGISGSAPQAQFAGLTVTATASTDGTEAGALGYLPQEIDIYNNSWGPIDDGVLDPIGPLALAALRYGAIYGRGGLGNVYVWSSGNGNFRSGDNANYDAYANSRYVIAVGANGVEGTRSIYSEPGANLLVVAPSNQLRAAAITTTDLVGAGGFNPSVFDICNPAGTQDYTHCFGGTSSSAPLVSGIVALMLEANSELTWRDVKHILVETSKPIDKDQLLQPGDLALPPTTGWQKNLSGRFVNHQYGFGMIDATAAVNLATRWKNVPRESNTRPIWTTVPVGPNVINDSGAAVVSTAATLTYDQAMTIETVEVVLNATHAYTPDLDVILTHTSPSGQTSRSILAEQRVPCVFGPTNKGAFDKCLAADELGVGTPNTIDYRSWKFSSVQHWGESTAGTWTLSVQDNSSDESSANGTFDSWSLQFFGTASSVSASALGNRIRELNLDVTGATIVVPGFEPFDNDGDSMLSFAGAIRDRASTAVGNDTSWLLDYDSPVSGFDAADSHFPAYPDADFGGQSLHSCYSGNYCAVGSDVTLLANGNEEGLDSPLVGSFGLLSQYAPATISLSFRYDAQDLENLNEALRLDVYHDGAWQ